MGRLEVGGYAEVIATGRVGYINDRNRNIIGHKRRKERSIILFLFFLKSRVEHMIIYVTINQ